MEIELTAANCRTLTKKGLAKRKAKQDALINEFLAHFEVEAMKQCELGNYECCIDTPAHWSRYREEINDKLLQRGFNNPRWTNSGCVVSWDE